MPNRRDARQAEHLGQQLIERLAAACPALELGGDLANLLVAQLRILVLPVTDARDQQGGLGQPALRRRAEPRLDVVEPGHAEAARNGSTRRRRRSSDGGGVQGALPSARADGAPGDRLPIAPSGPTFNSTLSHCHGDAKQKAELFRADCRGHVPRTAPQGRHPGARHARPPGPPGPPWHPIFFLTCARRLFKLADTRLRFVSRRASPSLVRPAGPSALQP